MTNGIHIALNPCLRAALIMCLFFVSQVSAQVAGEDQITVRVFDSEDLTLRPGVPLLVASRQSPQRALDSSGQWLLAVDRRVKKLRTALIVRTDPSGVARIRRSRNLTRIEVGSPFVEGRPQKWDGNELRLYVRQRTPVNIRVVAPDGSPMRGFAMALHADRRDVAVALTDENGVAVLAMPKDHDARLVVSPVGWIGPRDSFPTVAKILGRSEMFRIVMPPHGVLRVRPLLEGKPLITAVGPAHLDSLSGSYVGQGPRSATIVGVQFGPIALGQSLRGKVYFGGQRFTFEPEPLTEAGEIKVHGVETDPPRPKLAFRLIGPCLADCLHGVITVQVMTKGGVHAARVHLTPDGRGITDFGSGGIPKTRLLRVHLDWSQATRIEGKRGKLKVDLAKAWSGSFRVDKMLTDGVLDLGDLSLLAFAPVVVGRVIDRGGRPVGRAEIAVLPPHGVEISSAFRMSLFSDMNGLFEYPGPILRDLEGKPVPVLLRASFKKDGGIVEAELETVGPAGAAVELRLDFDSRKPPKPAVFTIQSKIIGIPVDVATRYSIALASETSEFTCGSRLVLSKRDGDAFLLEFERVPKGLYSLHVDVYGVGRVLDLKHLRVDGRGVADARLKQIDVGAGVVCTTARVLDADGVPIAGATVQGSEPSSSLWARSDQNGRFRLLSRQAIGKVRVSASGQRSAELETVVDGLDIRLQPEGRVEICLQGLPSDILRDELYLFVRPLNRRDLRSIVRVKVGEGDVARLPRPPKGWRILMLYWGSAEGGGGSRAVFRQSSPVMITDEMEQVFELRIDATAVSRLRAMQKDQKAKRGGR